MLNSVTYATKMEEIASKAFTEWWSGLTKDEILTYLHDQPTITADTLRTLLANTNCVLALDMRFSAADHTAEADFHTAK